MDQLPAPSLVYQQYGLIGLLAFLMTLAFGYFGYRVFMTMQQKLDASDAAAKVREDRMAQRIDDLESRAVGDLSALLKATNSLMVRNEAVMELTEKALNRNAEVMQFVGNILQKNPEFRGERNERM